MNRIITSFCCNCGRIVRAECALDDPRSGTEYCSECSPAANRIVMASQKIEECERDIQMAALLPEKSRRVILMTSREAINDANTSIKLSLSILQKISAKIRGQHEKEKSVN